jgi:hypothetical protein
VANATPKTKRRKVSLCHAISVDVTIDRDDFDPSDLARVIPKNEGTWDLTRETVTGPLRLGGRGNDEYKVVGRSSLHDTKLSPPHYHISVHGTLAPKPIAAQRGLPSVKEFFAAVRKGIASADSLTVTVIGEQTYPRDWWTGQTLPVPLPPKAAQDEVAQLTGIEISYASDGGTDRIMVTSHPERFSVVTIFSYDGVVPDLFNEAVQRALDLGARWFVDPSPEE